MSCGHCVARVKKTLSELPGVNVEDVTVGSARVAFDAAQTSVARIGQALDDLGFTLEGDATV